VNDAPHDLAAAFALDAVDADERVAMERHLAECAVCRAEVDGIREAMARLAPEAEPPERLRTSVLAAVQAEEASAEPAPVQGVPAPTPLRPGGHAAPRNRAKRWVSLLAAAAVVAAVLVVWRPWAPDQPSVPPGVTEVLEAPDAQRYPGPAGPVSATVVRSPEQGRSVLVVDSLPDSGAGKTYQAWFVPPQGAPVSAGLLDSTGPVLLQGNGSGAAAVALSVEPDGGSPQPTTTPVVVIPLS
jgi:anti-sigma-K factor RskA